MIGSVSRSRNADLRGGSCASGRNPVRRSHEAIGRQRAPASSSKPARYWGWSGRLEIVSWLMCFGASGVFKAREYVGGFWKWCAQPRRRLADKDAAALGA